VLALRRSGPWHITQPVVAAFAILGLRLRLFVRCPAGWPVRNGLHIEARPSRGVTILSQAPRSRGPDSLVRFSSEIGKSRIKILHLSRSVSKSTRSTLSFPIQETMFHSTFRAATPLSLGARTTRSKNRWSMPRAARHRRLAAVTYQNERAGSRSQGSILSLPGAEADMWAMFPKRRH